MKTLYKTNKHNEIAQLLSFPMEGKYIEKAKPIQGNFYYTTKHKLQQLLDSRFDPDGWENLCSNGQIISKDEVLNSRKEPTLIATAQAEANIIIHYKEIYINSTNNNDITERYVKIFRSAIGADQAINKISNNGGTAAIESAIKNAETNALKRACAKFGNFMGAALGSTDAGTIEKILQSNNQKPTDDFINKCKKFNEEIENNNNINKLKLNIIEELGFGNNYSEYLWIRRLLDKCD